MNDYLTIPEVAAATLRSRQWVYDRIADGTLSVERHGSRTYVTRESLRQWLDDESRALASRLEHYYDQLEEVLV